MNSIADDYFDEMVNSQHKIDVLLGGGKNNFDRKDSNLTEEFKKAGYSYVENREDMLNDKNSKVLGLFADSGLPKKIDRTEEVPSFNIKIAISDSFLSKESKNPASLDF